MESMADRSYYGHGLVRRPSEVVQQSLPMNYIYFMTFQYLRMCLLGRGLIILCALD